MFYDFVDFLVVILPTVIAIASVLVAIRLTKGEPHKFWWTTIIIVGIGTSILTGVAQFHARKEHGKELSEQRAAAETLRVAIQANEIRNANDMGYLKAKLEDSEKWNEKLSQFAPAMMKLAQSTEDFTRKQYEVKRTSEKELRASTMDVVKRIRDFSSKYQSLSSQQSEALMSASRKASSDAEKQQLWQQESQKISQRYIQRDQEFHRDILPDAMIVATELRRRKLKEPEFPPWKKGDVAMVLGGALAGSSPELTLADYLEFMAKQLPLK